MALLLIGVPLAMAALALALPWKRLRQFRKASMRRKLLR